MSEDGASVARRQPWPLCDSRGPRIGYDGCPRCRRPAAHLGEHRPNPEDGWGSVTWTDLLGESKRWRERLFPALRNGTEEAR